MTTTQLPDTASPSPLEVDLAVLPKVSLHDHLDGGLRVGTVLDLAREAGVEVPADTVEKARENQKKRGRKGWAMWPHRFVALFARTGGVLS